MVEKLSPVGFSGFWVGDKLKWAGAGTLALAVLAACGAPHMTASSKAVSPRPAPAKVAPSIAPSAMIFSTPRDAVAALYRLPSIPVTPADKQRFFSVDMAAALIKDSDRDDEVGVANDGDYRYDAQDFRIAGLHMEAVGVGGEAGTIRVAFRNFGKPQTVSYDLCRRRPGDWRIRDVVTPSGGSLRKLLGLPAGAQSKDC